MNLKTLAFLGLAAITAPAVAVTPVPNSTAAAFFTDGTYMSIPSGYFQPESTYSHVLYLKPTGNPSATPVDGLSQWWGHVIPDINNVTPWWEPSSTFPSFTEYNVSSGASYYRQCVAFAKAVGNIQDPTSKWYPHEQVIPSTSTERYVTWDQSWKFAGRIVAYFGNNPTTNTKYSSYNGTPNNHVGMFLKYEYDNTTFPANIIGFWIVDQNYAYDGKIRKHRILFNPSTGEPSNVRYYYTLDIR